MLTKRLESVFQSWLSRNVLIAIIYFLTGCLGLLLATPPGFASAIWPASGIALGWVLLFGWRVLPGIALGSFSINLMTSIQLSGHGFSTISWFIPLMIACGAIAQAWAGTALIRRFVGMPSGLDDVTTVVKTLFLGGLVATVINASWSVWILHMAGAVSSDRWLQNWVTWWIGDSIGVLAFTPLILVWGMPTPFYDRMRAIMVSIVLAVAFTLTVLSFLLVAKLEKADRVGRFHAESAVIVSQIKRQFDDYEEFTQLVRSFYDGSDSVVRTEFYAFVHAWLIKHPEVQAVEWAPRINHSQREALEQQISLQAGKTLKIHDRIAPNIYETTPPRSEYVPLTFVEPYEPNRAVQGYNIVGVQERAATTRFAAEHDVTVMTAPTGLIQDKQQHPAILLDTPVYLNHASHDPRWENIKGFIVMALKVDEVLAYLTRDSIPKQLNVVVSDVGSGVVLYGQPPDEHVQKIAKWMALDFNSTATIGQRQWRIDVWPTAVRLASYESWLTWAVLVIGLIGTSIAVSYALISSGRRQLLERMITTRTHELIERNAELEDARVEAVRANTAKGQFLANMSHEIRTPMNAILGFSHLLLAAKMEPQERNYLISIDNAARHLLSIINDILDFSKIDAGRMDIEHASFNLDELIQQVTQQVALSAADKGIEFILDMTTVLSHQLVGDSTRLRQVLLNLCHNAIKFTPQGEVIVRITTLSRTPDSINIEFYIQDSGIGIEPEQLSRLFAPFAQADSSTTRRYGGTGLGLVVSKRLVELMGGSIDVESTLGVGSAFSFNLNFALDPAVINDSPQQADLSGLKVLIVDDCLSTRAALTNMLTQLFFQATAVASSEEALQLLKQAQWEKPFDAVLLDLNMPGCDGVETARRICHEPTLASLPKLFLMSGNGYHSVSEAIKSIKFAAFLDKPVTPAMLKEAIYRAFQPGEATTKSAPLPTTLHFAPARLLLVEDNAINQKLQSEMLRRLGLSVDVVSNGQEALAQIDSVGANYDLVLMDIQMPIMDGVTATIQLRKKYSPTILPIIALTASAMTEERQKCLDIGMNSYIGKPIDPVELALALAQFLPLVAAPAPTLTAESKKEDDTWAQDIRQLDKLLKRQSFDAREKLSVLQPVLQAISSRQANEIATAMNNLDFKRARRYLSEVARVMEINLD